MPRRSRLAEPGRRRSASASRRTPERLADSPGGTAPAVPRPRSAGPGDGHLRHRRLRPLDAHGRHHLLRRPPELPQRTPERRPAPGLRQRLADPELAAVLGTQAGQLIGSVDTLPGSLSVLHTGGQWYATSISVGQSAIPAAARSWCSTGTPASQFFSLGDTPQFVIGVPLPAVHAAYFEVFSLDELASTLRDPGLRPGRRRPGHHLGRCGARPVGQWPGPATAGRGHRGRRGHRRRAARHPGRGR